MTTQLVIPQNFGALSTKFAAPNTADNDLSAGISSGYGLIGYRGKVWSIRHRGEEIQLMRDDGDGPRGSIEIVLLKASNVVSKIFYEAGWVEGSNAAPDCFSTNGVVPDSGALKKQCATCAACPKNAWGSRITPAGKQGKACSDSKRVAVVPAADITNELYGGPMLLRIPAASLQDLAQYGNKLGQMGYPYYAVATRVSFDPAESFPKMVFGAIRPLSDAEADVVLGMQKDIQVSRVLAEGSEIAAAAPAQQVAPAFGFEQPAPAKAAQPQPAPAPVQQPAPVQMAQATVVPTATVITMPAPAAQPAPAPQTSGGGFGRVAPVASAPAAQPASNAFSMPQGGAQPTSMPDPGAPPATQAEEDLDAQLNALLGPIAA